ncbi:3',5'-cyclic adenosine monophosphate phosphodiesterase CpdA [compost metagenome]
MKILRFSDTHLHTKPPYATRSGNYSEHMALKMDEIVQIAKEENVNAVLHDGDVYHSVKPEYEIFNQSITWFEQFDVPVYVNPGNHDLLGGDISSLIHTGLGALEKAGKVHIFRHKNEYVTLEKDGVRVAISGTPFMNLPQPEDFIVKKPIGVDFLIHSIHHMLIAEKWNDKVQHVSINEILDTEADITTCGHNHIGMAPVEYEGKWFLSDGSISRLRLPERTHRPKVTIYEVVDGALTFRYRYLTSVEYAEALFMDGRAKRVEEYAGVAFVNQTDQSATHVDISELLAQNAKRLGLERILPKTLTTLDIKKQEILG